MCTAHSFCEIIFGDSLRCIRLYTNTNIAVAFFVRLFRGRCVVSEYMLDRLVDSYITYYSEIDVRTQ